jgi:hypothetical protein
MSLDRFVYWNDEKPSFDDLLKILDGYLGEAARIESSKPHWIEVRLQGISSFPFKHLPEFETRAKAVAQSGQRWFEVFVDDDHVSVITRQSDEYTSIVADGFAALLTRFYRARAEGGG